AHAQNALVGYVHPFDEPVDPNSSAPLTNALPTDVARGKVDYYEVVGFSDHRASADVWYRLLNCGLRPPAAAGPDAIALDPSLRGRVGMNRVYARVPASASAPGARVAAWLDSLRHGHTMATNGPLLGLAVEDQPPGAELSLHAGRSSLRYKGFLRSIVPVDHLELVLNGKVVRTVRPARDRTAADFAGSVQFSGTGWLLGRARDGGA